MRLTRKRTQATLAPVALAVVIALAGALVMALPVTAFADHLSGSTNWKVTFTSDAKMTDNYSAQEWADNVGSLQPGDDITFTVNLSHEHATACDWYMSNEVLKSLEDGSAQGSAYTYLLTYTGPSGETRTLYDSKTVGGDVKDNNREGLNEATTGLEDFFYLDNLKKGQTAQVKLVVGLDGETEGNAYFDTLAQLKMKFAVELPSDNPSKNPPSNNTPPVVRTGDDTNLFPFYMVMAVSGALLLVLGIGMVRRRKRDRAGGAHVR